ncbi:hypothetical protein [Paenibacillus pinistramenti]|uniref:hypothetical protein n=1 Tax=Paenibacillus pinistramenti TaxID=1768003 RepID=UPI0011089508|nr:hypothetical protein [Paenibacillus pinistramenti]
MANGKQGKRKNCASPPPSPILSKLTPQQIAVIAGLLSNALSVDSILIDKDQRLEIVLGGSIKRKTRLDELISELGSMNVQDVLDALMGK